MPCAMPRGRRCRRAFCCGVEALLGDDLAKEHRESAIPALLPYLDRLRPPAPEISAPRAHVLPPNCAMWRQGHRARPAAG